MSTKNHVDTFYHYLYHVLHETEIATPLGCAKSFFDGFIYYGERGLSLSKSFKTKIAIND